MEWLFDPQVWLALVTLTAIEIVLGIDNIVFISILVGKLPREKQKAARTLGLSLAMLTRIALLLFLTVLLKLTATLFTLLGHAFSGRDIILITGGLFLLAKSTFEIHDNLEGDHEEASGGAAHSFVGTVVQIGILDIVFSLDSVITAIGLANQVMIMVIAIIIAVIFMIVSSGLIIAFIEEHPTIKMLALSFLLLIGIALIGEGFGMHLPKGYIYFAMAFSVFVEMLNMRIRRFETPPVRLRRIRMEDEIKGRGEG